jgi:hypothetical protein
LIFLCLKKEFIENSLKRCIEKYLSNKLRIIASHSLDEWSNANKKFGLIKNEKDSDNNIETFELENIQTSENSSQVWEDRGVNREIYLRSMSSVRQARQRSDSVSTLYDEYDIDESNIKRDIYLTYFNLKTCGGIILFGAFILCLILFQAVTLFTDNWVGYWYILY